MAVDWLKIKNDYINGLGSYRKLAEKYGVYCGKWWHSLLFHNN